MEQKAIAQIQNIVQENPSVITKSSKTMEKASPKKQQ
jgi:hypothetical protein